ncbi:DUF4230 domain-containing protein [Thermoflexibacter ruber]|uniref:DUF4230 domain-containing protein n=1 Tax=Thermoflexibacter ruber TaxID=1003 RepID=A0A1I2G1S3_9BACT|nr:DUF4230 domain-containing protein [Thermoflexibacter ruber]SFF11492.1 Protein of unknown function [Thermoflexibacter ruber]
MLKIFPWVLILLLGGALYYFAVGRNSTPPPPEVNFATVVEKVEAMGKMQLVRYQISDAVEYVKPSGSRFVPDAKAMLIVAGEAIGCVDLAKVKPTDLVATDSLVTLTIPQPELCVFKVDHQKSRVYDTKFTRITGETKIIDDAFKKAETQIKNAALENGILEETKKNAQLILKPMLEQLTGKKVNLVFELPQENIEKK